MAKGKQGFHPQEQGLVLQSAFGQVTVVTVEQPKRLPGRPLDAQ